MLYFVYSLIHCRWIWVDIFLFTNINNGLDIHFCVDIGFSVLKSAYLGLGLLSHMETLCLKI